MIQELLGGGVVGVGSGGGGPEERKISIINTGSSSSSSTSSSATSSSSSEQQQNLRCPRCDSSNTKFCYYNNYNLTQPRHFCKTCRRYWTKGGALRNVPIGGGCRKNKTSTVSASAAASKSAGKPNKPAPTGTTPDVGTKPGFGPAGFDELPSSPVLWPTPHNSQLLALLRAASQQNPNPNPILNSVAIKEEVVGLNMGAHLGHNSDHSHSSLAAAAMNAPISSQLPSFGLCSSFWRSQQHHHQQQQSQAHLQQHHHTSTLQHGMVVGEAHPSGTSNGGIQELYQRLRSSANYYNDHNSPSTFSNAGSSSACSIVESTGGAPIAAGDQLGYWNSPFSWSDLSTTNGAFP